VKWGSIRPGMLMAVPPSDMDDEYSGRTYLVLSVEGGLEGGYVLVTVLLSTGTITEWTGRRDEEYYEDLLVTGARAKKTGD